MIQAVSEVITLVRTHKVDPTIEVSNIVKSSPESSLISHDSLTSLVDDITEAFTQNINYETLSKQSEYLLNDFNESLVENSKLTMLPNFNIEFTGEENGDFLVIDLGGSTLRIAIIQILPSTSGLSRKERVNIVIEKKWTVHNNNKIINYEFFKWIALNALEVINCQTFIKPDDLLIKTGLTFSFSMTFTSHNSCKICQTGKGYTVAEEISEKDIKEVLESVFRTDYNLNIELEVIVNDSLAVYAAGSFMDEFMKLAIVLGTGLNLCCALNTSQVHPEKSLNNDTILVNSEMSFYGRDLIPEFATKYDSIIDNRFSLTDGLHFKPFLSLDPDTNTIFQPSELMASGRYLPELTRLCLVDLINNGEIFKNIKDFNKLYQSYDGFSGELMCFIHENDNFDLISEKIASEYSWNKELIKQNDISILKKVIDAIVQRAAFIIACTIVGFIRLLKLHNPTQDMKIINVGYVGSVLAYFNKYRNLIVKFVNETPIIKSWGISMDFESIDDSSIVGAAIGAAHYSL